MRALVVIVLAACTNPDGKLVIENSYTGVCTMTYAFGDDPPMEEFQPVTSGSFTDYATAGQVTVRFNVTGKICGLAQNCQFADSGLAGYARCSTYVAGDKVSDTLTIVDGNYHCSNTNSDEAIPVLGCGAGIKF
jgi:hypothetical protein